MKHLFYILIITTLLGCSTDSVLKPERKIAYSKEMSRISSFSEIKSELNQETIESIYSLQSESKLRLEDGATEIEVGYYRQTALISVIIPISKSQTFVKYGVMILDPEKKYSIKSSMIVTEEINGKINTIKLHNLSEQLFFEFDVDVEKKSIVSYKRITISKEKSLSKAPASWSQCMELAIESCSDDWLCSIECGLAFTWCVAAVSLACCLSYC